MIRMSGSGKVASWRRLKLSVGLVADDLMCSASSNRQPVAPSAFCRVDQTLVDVERWWTICMGRAAVMRRRSTTSDIEIISAELLALSDGDRLREEDPYTGEAVRGVPHHIICLPLTV